jgi:dolichol-phosphate mannosyltransferase
VTDLLRKTESPVRSLSLQRGGGYLLSLWRWRLTRFGAVGASGLLVNTVLLGAFTELGGIPYWISAVLATQGSTLWNFALIELWVFPDRQQRRARSSRLVMFLVMNNLALLLRGPLLVFLTEGLGVHYLLSNLFTLVSMTLVRYAISDRLIWATVRAATETRAPVSYDIHGIVTVESEVRLPELERFRSETSSASPTIVVRVGRPGGEANEAGERAGNGAVPDTSTARLHYEEGLGDLGFGTTIEIGDRIEVVVTPLLKWSPHVLYTNIMEPILRWAFADRGYALTHAACVAADGEALLLTAKTDTGKTTTTLRILDNHGHAFLSDDLVLLRPDGCVLTYPKPLTISYHTLKSVKAPMLSRKERLALVFQSRLHSRSGRRLAMLLARSRLPVATINAFAQLLVPPPKYHVGRLVPAVETLTRARAAYLVVIERAAGGEVALDEDEAVEILLDNTEDAFGFPPYFAIENFLHSRDDSNLRVAERRIVTEALDGVPAVLVRDPRMDWWQTLPLRSWPAGVDA